MSEFKPRDPKFRAMYDPRVFEPLQAGGLPLAQPVHADADVVPPIEQYRSTYVFLTPDKYSFDFIRVVAPADASILFDGEELDALDGCSTAPIAVPSELSVAPDSVGGLAQAWVIHSCQLSFPKIDMSKPRPDNLSLGQQNDGVHRILANQPVSLMVDGFDYFVSYAYAGGTELSFIVPL